MIQIQNLSKYFAKVASLDDVSVTFDKGDKIALMGANGAGKTTLIRIILGYYHATKGTVKIDGLDPVVKREEVLQQVSFVPQMPPPIALNVDDLLMYIQKSSNIKREEIFHYASQMDLDIKANLSKSFFKLSGGMKQKLLIAISFAKKSDIMIYDEPTANLDPKARDNFYKLLQASDEGEKIMLFVTHRLDEIKSLVNRQIYMDLGKIVSDENL